MTKAADYYIWTWADNNLPGDPDIVIAALKSDSPHPSVTRFELAGACSKSPSLRNLLSTCQHEVIPGTAPKADGKCLCVRLAVPDDEQSIGVITDAARELRNIRVVVYDACRNVLHESSRPKLCCFTYGRRGSIYDFPSTEIPRLLKKLKSETCGIFVHGDGRMVVISGGGNGFHIEWFEPDDARNRYRACRKEKKTAGHKQHGVIPKDDQRIPFALAVRVMRSWHKGNVRPAVVQWIKFSEAAVNKEYEKYLETRLADLEHEASSLLATKEDKKRFEKRLKGLERQTSFLCAIVDGRMIHGLN